MLPFYQFGQQVITALTNIAKFFFLPMNSPEFSLIVKGPFPVDFPWHYKGLIGAVFDFLIEYGGNLSLIQLLLSTFLPIFFIVTMVKWILPTS